MEIHRSSKNSKSWLHDIGWSPVWRGVGGVPLEEHVRTFCTEHMLTSWADAHLSPVGRENFGGFWCFFCSARESSEGRKTGFDTIRKLCFEKFSPAGPIQVSFILIIMNRFYWNTQFERVFLWLRFKYEAYTLGLEATRLRILRIHALHTTLIALHELNLNSSWRTFRWFTVYIRCLYHCMNWNLYRTGAAIPTIYALHATFIPLHELKLRLIRRAFLVVYALHTMAIPLHELGLGPIRHTFPIIYPLHGTVIP